jgi:hypothetical protein
MTQKKTTVLDHLLSYIDTEIEQVSTLPMDNPETSGYLLGMYNIRKKIEEDYIKKESEQIHNAFDEGYYNGAELLEYTADQYIGDNYFTKENNIYL